MRRLPGGVGAGDPQAGVSGCAWGGLAVARVQLNSHFPTTRHAPPIVVPVAPVSFSCSHPKPWNHRDSFLLHPTSNPVANPSLALQPPCFSLNRTIPPQGLCIYSSFCLKHSAPHSGTTDSLRLSGPCSNASSSGRGLPQAPSIHSPWFIFLYITPHYLKSVHAGSPVLLHEGRLSRLLLYPQHLELCPSHSRLTIRICSSDHLLP